MSDENNYTSQREKLDNALDVMGKGKTQGTQSEQFAKAEFKRTQIDLQERTTNAAEDTAKSSMEYARFIFWTLLILVFSALATYIFQWWYIKSG